MSLTYRIALIFVMFFAYWYFLFVEILKAIFIKPIQMLKVFKVVMVERFRTDEEKEITMFLEAESGLSGKEDQSYM